MEPLKEMFNAAYYQKLVNILSSVYPSLNKKLFHQHLIEDMAERSLNERLRHTSLMLKQHLPQKFEAAVEVLDQVIPKMHTGYTALVFPDFVGCFGKDKMEYSLNALRRYTSYGSSEFAIREFLKIDFEKALAIMQTWLKDPNPHVRRLVSEGTRPRLPWSFKLDAVIQNPQLTRSVLEALKADEELYVKKSVANHLNDIAKEHPDYMVGLVKSWDRSNDHTAWIVKHASRSLIKRGHTAALKLFDVSDKIQIVIHGFKLSPKTVKLGQTLQFEFYLKSESKKIQKMIVDYIIDYRKKGGGLSPKVFKLKEYTMKPGEEIFISKSQRMIDFTTRKHYPGLHHLYIQVNGKRLHSAEFRIQVC